MKNKTITASEESEQIAVVDWCKMKDIPIVHIPNEGKRSAISGARLKRAGMQTGFPDLFIPAARGKYHGLFVEMKVGRNKPTENQIKWLKDLSAAGYATCVRYGADEAIGTIERYLKIKNEN